MNLFYNLRRENEYNLPDRLDDGTVARAFNTLTEKWSYSVSIPEVRQKIRNIWREFVPFPLVKISENIGNEDYLIRCDDDDLVSSTVRDIIEPYASLTTGLIAWPILRVSICSDCPGCKLIEPDWYSGLPTNSYCILGKFFNSCNLHQRKFLIDDHGHAHRYTHFSGYGYVLNKNCLPKAIYIIQPTSTVYLSETKLNKNHLCNNYTFDKILTETKQILPIDCINFLEEIYYQLVKLLG